MTTVALGIDLGASAIHSVVLEGDGATRLRVRDTHTHDATDLGAVVVAAIGADAVAIDAPAAPSSAIHRDDHAISRKFRTARRGEIALGDQARIWVPWVTPPDGNPAPGWMQVGFSAWTALVAADHEPIEVYPAGVFRVLAGHVPPRKTTAAGRRARIELLSALIDLPAGVDRWSHDGLDALAAALTGHQQAMGIARRCRHDGPACDGSSIWLPAPPG